MSKFKGKPPGSGSGEMSQRTQVLRPVIELPPRLISEARRLRRDGHEPEQIAVALHAPLEEIEKALVQMRSRRPETTRGTLNVTLAAHRLVMQERQGDEPIWLTVDRMLDELLRLREDAARGVAKTSVTHPSFAPPGPSTPRRRQPLLEQGGAQLSLLPPEGAV